MRYLWMLAVVFVVSISISCQGDPATISDQPFVPGGGTVSYVVSGRALPQTRAIAQLFRDTPQLAKPSRKLAFRLVPPRRRRS